MQKILTIVPTAVQSYVEVNDMKHYSTVYELEKDGVSKSTLRWRLEHLRDVLTGAKMDGKDGESDENKG